MAGWPSASPGSTVLADALTLTAAAIRQALAGAGVRAALMGGIAVSIWHHVRATRDVDLLVAASEDSADGLLMALQGAGFKPRRHPPVLTIGSVRIVQLDFVPPGKYVEVRVDLMLADSPFHREAIARASEIELPGLGGPIHVISCEDLILFKLAAGRILDLADAAALIRANRDDLEIDYLRRWAAELGVVPDLERVWEEAFPGEAVPPSDGVSAGG
jgi:hypothetical protein